MESMMELHGSPISIAAQRALVSLYKKGLDVDFITVDLKSGAQKQEPFISMNVILLLYYKPMFGMTADEAAVEENEAKLAKVLDVYENRLSETKYLAGKSFTLADTHHIPTIQCLLETDAKKAFESRPRVNAWVADITARPAWANVLALRP